MWEIAIEETKTKAQMYFCEGPKGTEMIGRVWMKREEPICKMLFVVLFLRGI